MGHPPGLSGEGGDGLGGGLFESGGGSVTLTNSTLAYNTAQGGVGATTSGSNHPSSVSQGGGIFNQGTATLNNTIVADSPSGGDVYGSFTGSHNLFGSVALGPLQDNGGPTPTMALPAGSPAIDAGENSLIPPGVITDQRGPGFPRIAGGTVDISATNSPQSSARRLTLLWRHNRNIIL